MKYYLFLILFAIIQVFKGQSLDVEKEQIRTAKEIEILAFNGCCADKGYKAIYKLDTNGFATESSNFFKRKLLAKHKYIYGDKGRLTYIITLYDVNNKQSKDTTKYLYTKNTDGNVVFKCVQYDTQMGTPEYFSDFNAQGLPLAIL